MIIFTVEMFRDLGVCDEGLARVAAFGGAITNTPEAWRAYVARFPDAWRAPLFTAWRMRRQGWPIDPDLVWKIARIAFREAGKRHPELVQYAATLGPDNWREARAAAYAAYDAAAYDAAGRRRVRAEIVELAIAALVAADKEYQP